MGLVRRLVQREVRTLLCKIHFQTNLKPSLTDLLPHWMGVLLPVTLKQWTILLNPEPELQQGTIQLCPIFWNGFASILMSLPEPKGGGRKYIWKRIHQATRD
jgi:hypothetical protein